MAEAGDRVVGLDTPELRRQREMRRAFSSPEMQAMGTAFEAGNNILLGLPEAIGRRLDPTGAQGLDAYREANPGLSTTGQVAGDIAGAALGGGVLHAPTEGAAIVRGLALPSAGIAALSEGAGAAVARGIAPEGAGLARQILGRTAGFATEGALDAGLYEGAHVLTEEALGDHHLTADQVLARVGRSAAFGAGVGGGVGGIIGAGQAGGRLLRDAAGAVSTTWAQRVGTELHPVVARMLAGEDVLAQLRRGGEGSHRILNIIEGGDETLSRAQREMQDALTDFANHGNAVEEYAQGSFRRSAVRRRIQTPDLNALLEIGRAHV